MSVYPVYDGVNEVGTAQIKENGLYFEILCQCNDRKKITKLKFITANEEHLLGTCVLTEGRFVIKKLIPKKHIGPGPYRFEVVTEKKKRFLPVNENEPFAYLQYLREGKLCRQNGIFGVIAEFPDPPDSGQNP